MGSMSDQVATTAVWMRLWRGTCSGAKLGIAAIRSAQRPLTILILLCGTYLTSMLLAGNFGKLGTFSPNFSRLRTMGISGLVGRAVDTAFAAGSFSSVVSPDDCSCPWALEARTLSIRGCAVSFCAARIRVRCRNLDGYVVAVVEASAE